MKVRFIMKRILYSALAIVMLISIIVPVTATAIQLPSFTVKFEVVAHDGSILLFSEAPTDQMLDSRIVIPSIEYYAFVFPLGTKVALRVRGILIPIYIVSEANIHGAVLAGERVRVHENDDGEREFIYGPENPFYGSGDISFDEAASLVAPRELTLSEAMARESEGVRVISNFMGRGLLSVYVSDAVPVSPDPKPDDSLSNVDYTQDGSTVTVTDRDIPVEDGNLVIDVSGVSGVDTVRLTNNILNQIRQYGLVVALPEGSISFSSAASNMISSGRGGGVLVSAKKAELADLTTAQIEQVGNRPVFALSVRDFNNNVISAFGDNVTVSLPYTIQDGENPNSIVVYYVDANGVLSTIPNGRYENGLVTFTTKHFSLYSLGYNPVTFSDISVHWGRSVIERAAANGLVSGFGDGSYRPNSTLSRAQLMQMIYNVMALPLEQVDNPIYSDVLPNHWFSPVITAAYQAGFLDGLADVGSAFLPNQDITRLEMAIVFSNIVNAVGIGSVNEVDISTFSDLVGVEQKYVAAVETAINAGLFSISGIGGGRFGATSNMTRAQAAQVQINLLEALARHD
jgi:hypothetical protein